MPHDPRKHRRRSIGLKGYDCAPTGAYFVTICALGRDFLFGQVVAGRMRLNPAGEMVWGRWHN